jgi:hypothetical protein
MRVKSTALAAVLVMAGAHTASAQDPAASPNDSAPVAAPGGVVAVVDVSRLPIDLDRIRRQFQQTATIREERDGLSLRYFVDVYAKAPAIQVLRPEDNLFYGPVPYGGPTHSDMLYMMTPQEFRASGMMLGSRIGVSRKKSDKDR